MKEPFAKQAAKASLIVPFFCGGIILVTQKIAEQTPSTNQIIPLICAVLIALGVLLGVLSLFGIRKHGAKGILVPSLVGLLLNGLVVSIAIAGFLDGSNSQQITERAGGKEVFVNVQPPKSDTYKVPEHRYHFVSKDQSYLIDSLKEHKFDFLNNEIEAINKLSYEDLMYEMMIYIALDVFGRSDPSLEPHFNAWIKHSPGRWQAYLTRGVYYVACGWQQRGRDLAINTSDEQIRGMYHFLEKAKNDLQDALILKPGLIPAYTNLIKIGKTSLFSEQETKDLVDAAVKSCPGTYSLRKAYFRNILPRWGGSISEMESFLEETRDYYSWNKRLRMLEGRIDVELGDQKYQNEDYEGSLVFYNRAIEHGEDALYLHQRGRSLMMLDRVEEAVVDFTKAIQQRPHYELALEKRILCGGYRPALVSGGIEQVMKDANLLIEMHPEEDEHMMRRAVVKYQQRNFQAALDDLAITLKMNPENEGAQKLVVICQNFLNQQGAK